MKGKSSSESSFFSEFCFKTSCSKLRPTSSRFRLARCMVTPDVMMRLLSCLCVKNCFICETEHVNIVTSRWTFCYLMSNSGWMGQLKAGRGVTAGFHAFAWKPDLTGTLRRLDNSNFPAFRACYDYDEFELPCSS